MSLYNKYRISFIALVKYVLLFQLIRRKQQIKSMMMMMMLMMNPLTSKKYQKMSTRNAH